MSSGRGQGSQGEFALKVAKQTRQTLPLKCFLSINNKNTLKSNALHAFVFFVFQKTNLKQCVACVLLCFQTVSGVKKSFWDEQIQKHCVPKKCSAKKPPLKCTTHPPRKRSVLAHRTTSVNGSVNNKFP